MLMDVPLHHAWAALSAACCEANGPRWAMQQTDTGFIVQLVKEQQVVAQAEAFMLPDAIEEALRHALQQ